MNLWGLSRYAYTRGNPTTRSDPTGHDDFGGDFGGGDFGGGGDTGSTGFDPNAPSIDRSEDPNFGMSSSESGTGFDPNAPSIDRSEDPNFGMPSTGFDPNAPSIDRSEDPNFGMPSTGFDPNAPSIDRSEDPNFGQPSTGFDPNAPSIDRSEDPNFGMPQQPRDWFDIYDSAQKLAREWEQTVQDGGTVDRAAARQQLSDIRAEIRQALDDPNLSDIAASNLRRASLQLFNSGNIAGVVGPGDLPEEALKAITGSGARSQPGLPKR